MRGSDSTSGSLFSYVDLESRVPARHPLRVIKVIVDDVLVSLDAEFERLYEAPAASRSRLSGCYAPRSCRRSTLCDPSAS
jgi:hypothetical protein